jgi:hypothetical protein
MVEKHMFRNIFSFVCIMATLSTAGFAAPNSITKSAATPKLPALVFVRQGCLWLRETSGTVRQLTKSGRDANPAVSPDGKMIVFERQVTEKVITYAPQSHAQLWLFNLATNKEQKLLAVDGTCLTPSFDPSGKKVYFEHIWNCENQDPNGAGFFMWSESIGIVDIKSGTWHDLAPLKRKQVVEYEEPQYCFPVVTHDGKWLVWSCIPHEAGGVDLFRARSNGTDRQVISTPHKIRPDSELTYGYSFPAVVGKQGDLICLRSDLSREHSAVALIDAKGRERWHREVPDLWSYGHFTVSAKGLIAFACEKDNPHSYSIWIMDSRTRRYWKLLDNASAPAWVP